MTPRLKCGFGMLSLTLQYLRSLLFFPSPLPVSRWVRREGPDYRFPSKALFCWPDPVGYNLNFIFDFEYYTKRERESDV